MDTLLNKLNLFKNSAITQEQFLKEYWHKKPLLIKDAIAPNELSILPNKGKIQQLSCDENIQSRIVFKNPENPKNPENQYDVEYGPFIENDFDELDQECWNLLVSDVDKWQPKSREILKYFNFIRNWIFDDIMLSCGSLGGTVGPHTDHYDVFLIQVYGQRKWGFTQEKIFNPDLMPEQALKLMSQFKADESHILNPGDVLYLPPEVAHYGIATSKNCVTCSIGMRTPSHSELLTSFVDHIAQNISDNHRFEEPQFNHQPNIGEITQEDISNIFNILQTKLKPNSNTISEWFGKYITEYRSLFFEFNQYQELKDLDYKQDLSLSPFSKSSYIKQQQSVLLFVNGQTYQSSTGLAEMVCNDKIISKESLVKLNSSDKNIIESLFENGSLMSV